MKLKSFYQFLGKIFSIFRKFGLKKCKTIKEKLSISTSQENAQLLTAWSVPRTSHPSRSISVMLTQPLAVCSPPTKYVNHHKRNVSVSFFYKYSILSLHFRPSPSVELSEEWDNLTIPFTDLPAKLVWPNKWSLWLDICRSNELQTRHSWNKESEWFIKNVVFMQSFVST